MLIPKNHRFEDKAHLKWVKTLPCLICGVSPCDPAHISKGSGSGMGRKADDNRVVPLCREHHIKQGNIGEVSFWYEYGGWEFALRLAKELHNNTEDFNTCVKLIRAWRRKEWSLQS